MIPPQLEEFFFLLVPTAGGKGDIQTLWRLAALPNMMGKRFFPLTVSGRGCTDARTVALEDLKIQLDRMGVIHKGKIRGMFWDDDLIIRPTYNVRTLAESIVEADKHAWNLVGNYRTLQDGDTVIANVLMHHKYGAATVSYTDEEIASLKNLDPLPDTVSGLGFYYGDISLDYKFHWDSIPEDLNFFIDNKLALRFSDVQLLHEKKTLI